MHVELTAAPFNHIGVGGVVYFTVERRHPKLHPDNLPGIEVTHLLSIVLDLYVTRDMTTVWGSLGLAE
jgi:hypothetical protein